MFHKAVLTIRHIRSSDPSRAVSSRAGNVTGRYPSRKMGHTVQFESHKVELCGIYEYEYDHNVLEYYDQPPPIKLDYLSTEGKRICHLYNPDFFVLRRDWAGYEEWKPEKELLRLEARNPNRYHRDEKGQWQSRAATDAAHVLGLSFRVRSSEEIDWTKQRNLRFLEDYLRLVPSDGAPVPFKDSEIAPIVERITRHQGITLAELLEGGASVDLLYTLVAFEKIWTDLSAASFAGEPDRVRLFTDSETGRAHGYLAKPTSSATPTLLTGAAVAAQIEVGTVVIWDERRWDIVNVGQTSVALRSAEGHTVEWPHEQFQQWVVQGRLSLVCNKGVPSHTARTEILEKASSTELGVANERQAIVLAVLAGESPAKFGVSERTVRVWKARFCEALTKYGNGYLGLIPKLSKSGRRGARLSAMTVEMMDKFIDERYETERQMGKFAAYSELVKEWEAVGAGVASYQKFMLRVAERPAYEHTRKRMGNKAAYVHEPVYWELEETTPRHGDRPFEIAHIDHTELDIELKAAFPSLGAVSLGRPWVTFMVDAYSRRLLAFYLTFDSPSYRSCMMVMRECVKKHSRLPSTIVVDGGKEFGSVYFETLLAYYNITKKVRPGAKPRFGGVCERLFGTTNTLFVHNLLGNTQITKNVRQITKAVDPKNLAVWDLPSFSDSLAAFTHDFYDRREHPALGTSPRDAFHAALAASGKREHTLIVYDETFRIFTLPTTNRGTAKVVPNQGCKIQNIYYWCEEFRDPHIERTQVAVRYDPFDVGSAWAYLKGRWIRCRSEHYTRFAGRTEKEIALASDLLRARAKGSSLRLNVTAKMLADCLGEVYAQEPLLLQRLKDSQLRDTYQPTAATSGTVPAVHDVVPFQTSAVYIDRAAQLAEPLASDVLDSAPLEEFW
ncbi:MAG: DDE-type integrase/transposase/recombinase [Gemmatimonadaceae bacterium]|nr:DDE-type integrase/transposase/recombinase [Gloeobacterales cyanobacterium ES-bin-141]